MENGRAAACDGVSYPRTSTDSSCWFSACRSAKFTELDVSRSREFELDGAPLKRMALQCAKGVLGDDIRGRIFPWSSILVLVTRLNVK